jgi:hypothetical protein
MCELLRRNPAAAMRPQEILLGSGTLHALFSYQRTTTPELESSRGKLVSIKDLELCQALSDTVHNIDSVKGFVNLFFQSLLSLCEIWS